ncbi:phosphocholine-specific phospholipase C [Dyadobacter sp. CY326]|uniref:phosphocholine-specific phospholipase C n=1 Tax=Dyadobacter sp. CY326 TaxID=2907300 RepID=UPI001F42619E|nr:phospholipase C, phosphocholine-specific [Dyadobacter sp. CY326]MCE7068557.1 phospholipase C, phosphocholine-specific [Dyadobacter sp. CY326]
MESRREFIKKATLLTGAAGMFSVLPASIQKALAIDPKKGSTYLDAEHVVILMQENRSFDHCYGSLRGVRGFNDPRAITLPNNNLVWLQTNAFGETFVPFRLNMKESNATWMGSLPHSWPNQVDARNGGKYDQWLVAKQPGHKEYAKMPLTQGFYNREDIPFYYALADAFTVCDQNFCSSLTGTTPNRLYLWSGTVREKPEPEHYANIRNENVSYDTEATWTTFPERLEDNGVSWRIYQNEISLDSGLTGVEDAWLANFTDNPIEWFTQYNVRFHTGYQQYQKARLSALPGEIQQAEEKLTKLTKGTKEAADLEKSLVAKRKELIFAKEEIERWSPENYEKLSQRAKNIHQKAFTTNKNEPEYRKVTTVKYLDGDIEHEAKAPQGDILHQFRSDVKSGALPTVSWLVAPENFSDHPTSPWYGAWYVSEVMDILTADPEVWKKTIFILCYDENDGYFDHVPPFVVPNPYKDDSGAVSEGIDCKTEFVTMDQDMTKKEKKESRESPIGLGFRVPLVVASPWNRGGNVCSEVFDHTSILQFLEKFVSHKSGKKIEETNISAWRRTICGDLTSTFTPYDGEKIALPTFLAREEFMESIYNAQFKKLPNAYKALSKTDIEQINKNPLTSPLMPKQEPGTRPSCPIPYELAADGALNTAKNAFEIKLEARNGAFRDSAAGAPFIIYAPGKYKNEDVKVWNYAVKAGHALTAAWKPEDFEGGKYHLRLYGPNGFFREFQGNKASGNLKVGFDYELNKSRKPTGNVMLRFDADNALADSTISIIDNAYHANNQSVKLQTEPGSDLLKADITLNLESSFNWYDFSIVINTQPDFLIRYAGHVETGQLSTSDPVMGQFA